MSSSMPGTQSRLIMTLGLIGCLTGCQHFQGTDSWTSTQRRSHGSPALNSPSTERVQAISGAQEADVHIALARAAEQQGDFESAMKGYTQAVQRDKKRADACVRLAILHDRQGQFKESEGLYKRALDLHPADPDIFCDMGYSYYLQRRWAEAERCLKQALAIQSDHPRAHNNLALLRVRDGHPEEALAEFRKGGSSPSLAHCNVAFALSLQGQLAEARNEYTLALAAEPGSKVAQEQLQKLELVATRMTPDEQKPTNDPQLKQAKLRSDTKVPVATSQLTPVVARPQSINSPVPRPSASSPVPATPAHTVTASVKARSNAQPDKTVRSDVTKPGTAALPAARSSASPSQSLPAEPEQVTPNPAARSPKLSGQPTTPPEKQPSVTVTRKLDQTQPLASALDTGKPVKASSPPPNQTKTRRVEVANTVSNPLSTKETKDLKPMPRPDADSAKDRNSGSIPIQKAPCSSAITASQLDITLPPLVPSTR